MSHSQQRQDTLELAALNGAPETPASGTIFLSRSDSSSYFVAARIRDITMASLLLLLLLPLLVVVAILIKLESPGGVLFSQERVGTRRRRRDGATYWELTTFRLYKLRSMTQEADPTVHERHVRQLLEGEANLNGKAGYKLSADRRITRVGRFIRKTSIDELPQLFNVIRGDMSLIGPRPVPVYEAPHYERTQPTRFAAKPGITGLWQVRGRCLLSPNEMAALDAEYVERQSMALDLKILVQTVPAVLTARGAG